MRGKMQHLTQTPGHSAAILLFAEKSLQALWRHLLSDAFRICALRSDLNGMLIDIRGKDAHLSLRLTSLQCLLKQHRNGIGFFTG